MMWQSHSLPFRARPPGFQPQAAYSEDDLSEHLTMHGHVYFFTVTTHERRPLLCHTDNVELLYRITGEVAQVHPFDLEGFVLLPDHLHCIWRLPENDTDYDLRWHLIKSAFSRHCRIGFGEGARGGIWQQNDWRQRLLHSWEFAEYLHYIHYNPVKHGWVASPMEWPYSTFHGYVRKGWLDVNWGQRGIPEFRPGLAGE